MKRKISDDIDFDNVDHLCWIRAQTRDHGVLQPDWLNVLGRLFLVEKIFLWEDGVEIDGKW